jgi:hypothetical protein
MARMVLFAALRRRKIAEVLEGVAPALPRGGVVLQCVWTTGGFLEGLQCATLRLGCKNKGFKSLPYA